MNRSIGHPYIIITKKAVYQKRGRCGMLKLTKKWGVS